MPDWLDPGPLVRGWLLVALIGAMIAVAVRRLSRHRDSILPPQRRRAVAWSGAHVFLAFLVFLYVPVFIVGYINPIHVPDPDPEASKRFTATVAGMIGLPLQIAMWLGLARLAGCVGPVFGFVPRRLGADFTAGYRTWLLLSPVVYVVSIAAIVLYVAHEARPPEEHPVIKMLQTGVGSIPVYVLFSLQAMIAAPVGEELFFRGIMQPFLADRPWGGVLGLGLAAFIGVLAHWPGQVSINDLNSIVSAAAPALFALAVLPLYWWIDAWVPARWLPIHDRAAQRQVARGIVGTAILFANVHANVWPTPIPLFVLALGLGWLAYRTQGVVAPIVLHMLFNAIPIVAVFWPATH